MSWWKRRPRLLTVPTVPTLSALEIPPIRGTIGYVATWIEQLPFETGSVLEGLEYTVVFSERNVNGYRPAPGGRAGLEEILDPSHYERASWLGGPAAQLDGDWPRRPDGVPLAHVATFDLNDSENLLSDESVRDWIGYTFNSGLPNRGLLQIFHDLETYGDEPDDRSVGGWLVRWTDVGPDVCLALVDAPDDLDLPSETCQALYAHPGISLPSPHDHLGKTDFDEVEHVYSAWNRAWAIQRFDKPRGKEHIPFTHLYGHSHSGDEVAKLDILPKALPLTDEYDRYRLIADIESWTALDGWFGNAGHLEIWIRDSDLRARAFDQAWCIIRTG